MANFESQKLGYGFARAGSNLALVKYWGKSDLKDNLPAAGSISLTLDSLFTSTEVEFFSGHEDYLEINGEIQRGKVLERTTRFLDRIRKLANSPEQKLKVSSTSTFPVAAGLASSASGFAALTGAAIQAFGLNVSERDLSALARTGSGSAARSVFGGFVEMHREGYATPLVVAPRFKLQAVVLVFMSHEKEISSTEAMERTRQTSPYYENWLKQVDEDLPKMRAALASGDFSLVAKVAESNCLRMHASAMAAEPGILYFKAGTYKAIETIRKLREYGIPVFFSIDAGPNVVAFVKEGSIKDVLPEFRMLPNLKQIICCSEGPGLFVSSQKC